MTEEAKEVKKWLDRIISAEKKWDTYHDLIKEIREYYKNEKHKNKQNVFWSSIETLKPFIYFKPPVPYVERKSKFNNQVEDAACKILEKALVHNLEAQDFDGVIKYARNDYLLSGLGLTVEKYVPTFEKVMQEVVTPDAVMNEEVEILTDAKVETTYIDPKNLLCDCNHVSVWEDCQWVAQIIEMTKQEVIDQFGEQIADKILEPGMSQEEELDRPTKVYRIWDKKDNRIIYLSKEVKDEFLRVDDDVLKIAGFYPFPKPVFATLANDGLIPVPDYSEIKCQLDELDGVNNRMRLTMQALKVSGAYDGSFPELANLLDKDVTLIQVSDFDKIREKGGIEGFVGFMPIGQYIDALAALAERRAQLIQAIYEITGVSDIMRGNSDPSETATAVTKKTNFGTLRNQDRQNDFQRYLTDVLKIKAEIICEMWTPDLLAQYAEPETPQEVLMAAIELLKTDKIRNLTLGIETDTSFMQDEQADKTLNAVKVIQEMITAAFQTVSVQPALLPLYKQMIDSVVLTLPNTRQFSAAIDEAIGRIEAELAQPAPEEQQPNPEVIRAQADMIRAQADVTKNANELAVKQEANAIKQEEVELKKQAEDNKIMMTKYEADLQYELKKQGADDANITTGNVKGF
ncbi:MAG: hypothetical protein IIW86_06890 [Clostridia bacterium]|nr:hypothetical protein [Clostridia bacterium]